MTTEQALTKILALCKNNGTTLDELLKLPVLDAEGKIPAAALRIVGALSAGAVIESGDNANGNYVRFADGTQVCWITALTAQSGASGESANYATADWTFPSEFIGIPCALCVFQALIDGAAFCLYRSEHLENGVKFLFQNTTGALKVGSVSAEAIAIGKWK